MDDTRPDQDKGIPKQYGGHVGSRNVSTLGFDELNGKRVLLKYPVTCGGSTATICKRQQHCSRGTSLERANA